MRKHDGKRYISISLTTKPAQRSLTSKGSSAEPPCILSWSESSGVLCALPPPMELKCDQYKNVLEFQKSVMAKSKAIPIYEWEKEMKRLKDRTKECIRANGDYFH